MMEETIVVNEVTWGRKFSKQQHHNEHGLHKSVSHSFWLSFISSLEILYVFICDIEAMSQLPFTDIVETKAAREGGVRKSIQKKLT